LTVAKHRFERLKNLFICSMHMQSQLSKRSTDILDAFIELAKRYTVDRITMQDVARHIGLSVGTLYQEFKGKKEIMIALIDRQASAMFERMDGEVQKERSALKKLHALTVRFYQMQVETLNANPSIAEFVLRGDVEIKYILSDFRTAKEAHFDRYLNRIVAVLKEGINTGEFIRCEVDTTARLFVHAFKDYSFEAYGHDRRASTDREVEAMFNTLTRGICHAAGA
jgi:AcrR family transcriptional regulator